MPQTHRLITYHLSLHTRGTSSLPGIEDQPPQYLRTNHRPIVSPHPVKSLSNPPARRRNLDKRRRNNSSYRLKKRPLKLTSTRQSPLPHPQMTPFYFVDLLGAVGRDRYRSNQEERPPYAHPNTAKRPRLHLMRRKHSPLLAHGVKSM